MLELLALLALAGALGLPGAWRWLAFGLLGPVVLVLGASWWQRTNLAEQPWWWYIGMLAVVGLAIENARIKRGRARIETDADQPTPPEQRTP